MMYDTLLLDRTAWDLVLDSSGNIAMASPSYAVAQDVASAIRTFQGEAYYDTTKGIPYFQNILGQLPPISLFKGYAEKEAKSISGVVSARCVINSFSNRTLSGQVLFVDENGESNGVSF